MKRIAAAAMLFILLFTLTLTGCNTLLPGEKVSPYSLVKSALEMVRGLADADLKYTVRIQAESDLLSLDSPVILELKVKDFNGENPVGTGMLDAPDMLQKNKQEFFFDKEFIYLEQEGAKVKIPWDGPEVKLDLTFDPDDILKELPEESLKEAETVLNEDGSKTVSADISEELFESLYGEITRELEDGVVEDLSGDGGASLKMSEYHVDITVLPSGYLGAYSLIFGGELVLDGSFLQPEENTLRFRMKADLQFIDPGKAVQVALPADLEDYTEFAEYMEKYPFGLDWEYNEDTGKYDYVGTDGEYQYDPEREDWYRDMGDGERYYFNEDYPPDVEWEYNKQTGKYDYVGTDGAYQYDPEKEDWYLELAESRYYFNEMMEFPPHVRDEWDFDENGESLTYLGEDEHWHYDGKADDWYYQKENGERRYFRYYGVLFYNEETGKYTYIGEDEDWMFDEKEKTWYRGDREAWFS